MMNRFGSSVAESQLAEIETAMAEKLIAEQSQQGVFIPSNISLSSNVFVSFCWDNNDIAEETLSGKGTTHCTNGILL